MINLDHIKKNIILKKGISYFDFTGSGLAYKIIEDEILKILQTYANTHSDSAGSAIITQNLYENARKELYSLLDLSDDFYLFPCGFGSTAAIKKFQEILGLYAPPATKKRYLSNLKNLPLVIVGPYEHHSNDVSFREGLCKFVRLEFDEKYGINLDKLERILAENQDNEIIGSFSACSNVTGVVSDYIKIYELFKRYGGILAIDAASISAYKNLDCNYFDALFLSPHKLLGGVGSCGLLAIRKELYDNEPTFAGGGTVHYVSRTSHIFKDTANELEQSGTPPIIQLIRAKMAYELRNNIGFETICQNESELGKYFENELLKIDGVKFYCPLNLRRIPIFAFNIEGISPYDLSAILSNDYGIQTRAGCACAGPYGHELLGLDDGTDLSKKPGWIRVSIHYTHTFEDIDFLIDSIKKSVKKYKTSWAEELSIHYLLGQK